MLHEIYSPTDVPHHISRVLQIEKNSGTVCTSTIIWDIRGQPPGSMEMVVNVINSCIVIVIYTGPDLGRGCLFLVTLLLLLRFLTIISALIALIKYHRVGKLYK